MRNVAEKLFYSLSIVALGAGLFALQPSESTEITALQDSVKEQFGAAFRETAGDLNFISDVAFIYESVSEFYSQSADSFYALLSQPQTDEDIIYVFDTVHKTFADAFSANQISSAYAVAEIRIPANFMAEEPIFNIVPGSVAATSFDNPWVIIQDGLTGQEYCVASFNGEINKYLGRCKM